MRRSYLLTFTGLSSAIILGLGAWLWWQHSPEAKATDASAIFLQKHWKVPVPPQGQPPAHFSPLEASLNPKDCGLCHPTQFLDWQTTIHSKSMGPGVYGQLLDMADSDPETYTLCATCHTPLSEQIPHQQNGQSFRPNPVFDAALQQSGLVCAACHVRQHQRFGPPRRAEWPPIPADTVLPHGGFVETPAFQRSEFCKSCHQFGPTDLALNGKLLENTYNEWKESPYATAGIQCQNCHMPDRRHLWRGIHDPEMVKQAMTITITPDPLVARIGEKLQATITMINSGAGHYLPTYVTPKIFIESFLVDAQGQELENSMQQAVIGRDITLDLSQEIYDTRIPPRMARAFAYTRVVPATATALRVRVVVHPDHFYKHFFEATLQNGGGGKGRQHLEAALQNTINSPFTVFERDLPLQMTPN